MKKKIVIFGNTMFSKEMMYFLKEEPEKWEILGFTLDPQYIEEDEFCGFPVFPFDTLDQYVPIQETEVLIAVGYSEMNHHREAIFQRCKEKKYAIASYIHPSVVNHAKKIGEGNIILDFVQLCYDCEIGDGNIIKGTSDVAHDCVVGNFNYFAGLCHVGGASQIGDRNFFGVSCLVKSVSTIGNENLIGAGSYVSVPLKEHMVVSPAKCRVVQASERTIAMFLE